MVQIVIDNSGMKVKLDCHLCNLTKECDVEYFGKSFSLFPHPSDDKYNFSCSDCVDAPRIKHYEKEWDKIGLCALTTLQFVSKGDLYTAEDVISFVSSHFNDIAVNKDYATDWRNTLLQEMQNCKLIYWHAALIGAPFVYSLSMANHTKAVFFPEECLELRTNDLGEKECKIRWTGFSATFATWEPFTNLRHCREIFTTQQREILFGEDESELSTRQETTQGSNSAQPLIIIKEEYILDGGENEDSTPKSKVSTKRKHVDPPLRAKSPDSDSDPEEAGRDIIKIDNEDSDFVIEESESDFYEDEEEVTPSVKEFVPNRVKLQIRKNFKQKAIIAKLERDRTVCTPHHTFLVNCSKCGATVPVKELGDDAISPICINWELFCAKCTNGKLRVVHSDFSTLGSMILRALFILHVKNPAREFWDAAEIGNEILTNPTFVAIYNQTFKASVRIKLCGLVNTGKVRSFCRGINFLIFMIFLFPFLFHFSYTVFFLLCFTFRLLFSAFFVFLSIFMLKRKHILFN
eukprot:Phypoly_transcript_04577.p1 GENE.Phypoly_transcript_04577~~Phypoly_transcript_04577.p1  ORF type:complete len:519 (+),score=56.09 Phypoly_transcript_04577:83-1639(+)